MELSNAILNKREEKLILIKKYLIDYNLVTLKANIPGPNKKIKEAYFLVRYFHSLITQLNPLKIIKISDEDGPINIYLFNKKTYLKSELILLEESNPIGRLVDLDFYCETNDDFVHSINRKNLRKCFICDNPAFVCSRNKTHSINELLLYINNKVNSILLPMIKTIIDDSITQELTLEPKFGLVCVNSQGSHQDMNFDLMIKSKNVIINDLVIMFMIGFNENDLSQIFTQIRNLGKITENKMFNITNGVNTYKGLIFVLGITLAAIGYSLSHNQEFDDIFSNIKKMTMGITEELKDGYDTFGKVAFNRYLILGIRGEVENGLTNVQKIIKYNLSKKSGQYQALTSLIAFVDDTVLLKRCNNYQLYVNIKKKFFEISHFDYENNNYSELINQVTEECINKNLSFGGSADLLIVAMVIYKLKKLFI